MKGNVIDPIEIVKQYGTDAVRFTLASMASPGTDIAFNIARTEGYRAFANKIWNAARFIFMNVDRAAEAGIKVDPTVFGSMPTVAVDAPLEDRWIVSRINGVAADVNLALRDYRFDEAANLIYQFFWGDFCDWYLEIVKLSLDFSETAEEAKTRAALLTLVSVFEASLRLLSPFMPFITEDLWHAVYKGVTPEKTIALTSYPQLTYQDPAPREEMLVLKELITNIRWARKELGVEEKLSVDVLIASSHPVLSSRLESIITNHPLIIQRLAKVNGLKIVPKLDGPNVRSKGLIDFEISYEKKIDVSAERDRLTKECARLEKLVANDERALNDPGFTGKAPAHIVEGRKKQLAENRLLLEKAKAALDALPKV
jgi:valyl-tRNA synthetase